MIDFNKLKQSIAEQRERLKKMREERKVIEQLHFVSFDLKEKCLEYIDKEIDSADLNLCGAEDKYYDIMNDAMDMAAEMGVLEND